MMTKIPFCQLHSYFMEITLLCLMSSPSMMTDDDSSNKNIYVSDLQYVLFYRNVSSPSSPPTMMMSDND